LATRRELVGEGVAPAQAGASADDLDGTVFDLAITPAVILELSPSTIQGLGPRGRLLPMGVASPTATVAPGPYDVLAKELSTIGSNLLLAP
jgi:hypothetical protein